MTVAMDVKEQYKAAKAAGHTATIKGGVVFIKRRNGKLSKWDPAKHPRGPGGKFANTPGGGTKLHAAKLATSTKDMLHNADKGKLPPANWKFYKPGYKPKAPHQIPGANAPTDGAKLWSMKKNGAFANDYEFWLYAQKLAAAYKKKHPNGAASPNGLVNYAFHLEQQETGKVSIGNVAPPKMVHHSTTAGVKISSKHAPPGALTKYVKTMPGATGAQVWKDDKGQEWLVKGLKQSSSNAYSNKNFAVLLEEGVAKIQNKAGLRSATSHKIMHNGQEVLAQKMFGDVKPAFLGEPKVASMTDADLLEMQKQQIFDWVISNWDTHTGNFLKDDKGIIGIDKGQAFKFFGKDKLSPDYVPVTPLGNDKLTYSVMWKQYIDGKVDNMFDFDSSPGLKTFAERLQNIPDDEYKALLKPYAEAAYKQGILAGGKLNADQFLEAAVKRKNNVIQDFTKFYADMKAKANKDVGIAPKPAEKLVDQPKANSGKKPGDVVKSIVDLKEGDIVTMGIAPIQVTGITTTGWINYKTETGAGGAMNATEAIKTGKLKYAGVQDDKLAPGYDVVQDGNTLKWKIKKPNGTFSTNKSGDIKEWATKEEALNSSTMAKYKANPQPKMTGFTHTPPPLSVAGIDLSGATEYPGITPAELQHLKDLWEQNSIDPLQGDQYSEFESLAQKIKNSKKAKGAAQIVSEFHVEVPDPGAAEPVKTKLPTPKWKKKGGAPPALEKATGPNALEDGKKLYAMKKAGHFNTDDELWKEASKLSNAYKSKVQKANPGKKLVSGEDYSSPNQIRNVAQRLEFDEVGDVIWETKAEKTSATIKLTGKQGNLHGHHHHVPTVTSVGSDEGSTASSLNGHLWDKSKPVGSYQNPHAFANNHALNIYGDKYVKPGWAANQKKAWYSFSGSYSGMINTYFRVGSAGFSSEGSANEAKKLANDMLDAFKASNNKPLDDWTVVARNTDGGWEFGLPEDHADFDNIKAQEGKIVRNKCPVSSSLNSKNTTFAGKPVRIYYKLPPGFKGIFGGNHTAHSSENEWILPPGMAYKIIKVEKQDTGRIDALVEVVDVTLPDKLED